MTQSPHILILAAGQGKRMQSKLPKVLHEVLFQPMVHHVLDLAYSLPHSSVSLIIGHGGDEVKVATKHYSGLQYFEQKEQKGTGHAVRMAEAFLSQKKGSVLILSGDVILLKKSSMEALLQRHEEEKADGSLVSTRVQDPKGYGRILRQGNKVVGIREDKDCSAEEKLISEINAGIYCFDTSLLLTALSKISNNNKQGEFYLTDAIEILVREGKKVLGVLFEDAMETMGINDRVALMEAEAVLQKRVNQGHLLNGVTLRGMDSILIDTKTQIAADVTIESGTRVVRSTIASGTVIESDCRILQSKIGPDVKIKQGCYIEESEIGEHSAVGPYAHLRPGSKLGKEIKIGNFVEIKKSTFKDGAKASHLSYIGDAEVGKNVNLGCGFITCNYDGKNKHKTIIEDDVFIGSDSQAVAPVTIGAGSYVASGSTVTMDVPADSLVISRGKQVTKLGYAKKYFRK